MRIYSYQIGADIATVLIEQKRTYTLQASHIATQSHMYTQATYPVKLGLQENPPGSRTCKLQTLMCVYPCMTSTSQLLMTRLEFVSSIMPSSH